MSTTFFKLPSELRNTIYELCLLQQEPIDPWTNYNQRPELTPGLLRTNKLIHHEASLLFYAQNRFDFTMATPEDIALFLGIIGRNANYIQHVYINFPNLRDLEPGNVTLVEGSISIIANIQSSCVNLSTLTTSLNSTNTTVLQLDALDYPKVVTEALTLVNTRFRAISSLQSIVVEIHEDNLSNYMRTEMETQGWTINVIEYVEEWDSDRSSGYFENAWVYDYNGNNVSYDIDYDSDFWRRAGD